MTLRSKHICGMCLLSCRILCKFLDNYQEDLLPWHESIEPCLSSMTAFINDRDVRLLTLSALSNHRCVCVCVYVYE